MSQTPYQVILNILDTIGYEDDKEKFANDFLTLCLQKAILNLSKELSQDKQDQLIQRISLISQDQMEQLILEYFPQEKLGEAMKVSTKSTLEEYINTVTPTLSKDQEDKLNELLSSSTFASA